MLLINAQCVMRNYGYAFRPSGIRGKVIKAVEFNLNAIFIRHFVTPSSFPKEEGFVLLWIII